jgi:predicted O-methyltransferase YrrM
MRDLHSLIPKGIGGGCSKSRGEAIRNAVLDTNAQLCVEIGVFMGSSLMYFAEAAEETGGRVIGIDPYKLDSLKNTVPNKKDHDFIYNVLFTKQKTLDDMYRNLASLIHDQGLTKVTLIREKSESVFDIFEQGSIDVLHIDGNHDEEYVTKDIKYYLPLVRKGGYIIMDDIKWDGVKNAISKHMTANLVADHGSFSVYQK